MDNIENQLNKFQEKSNKEIEEELQKAYKNAEQFSLIPLLKLIYKTTKIDL
jgi:NADH:ubiquinone oxidoreductase subunit E